MSKKITLAVLLVAALALIVSASLLAKSKDYGWLGVYTQEVEPEMAKAFDLSVKYGAIVNEVINDGPADKAGIEADDVIVEFNGKKVTDEDELVDYVRSTEPGEIAKLVVMRGDDKMDFEVEIGEFADKKSSRVWGWVGDDDVVVAPNVRYWSSGDWDDDDLHSFYFLDDGAYLGVSLIDLSEGLADYFGADHGGALVSEVSEDSPAEAAGIKAGDVIVAINDEEVEDSDDVVEIIDDLEEGDNIKVAVLRDHKSMAFEAELDEATNSSIRRQYRAFTVPDIPKMNIRVPHIKGMHLGNFDDDMFDSEEFERAMQEMKEELRELKIQYEVLKEKVDH